MSRSICLQTVPSPDLLHPAAEALHFYFQLIQQVPSKLKDHEKKM